MNDLPATELIFSGLPDALILIDSDHRISKVNPAAENFLGTSAKHLLGQSVDRHIQFGDRRLEQALIDNDANLAARRMAVKVRGNRAGFVDFSIQSLPSNALWRVISLSPLPSDGPELAAEQKGVNDFSVRAPDILGHEIKNPLAAIRGAAQLLERSLEDEQKTLTSMIKSEVQRIASLLDRMQSLSTTQPAKLEPVNVHTLIDQARKSLETGARGQLTISDEFDPSLPDVLVDPDAMMQILTNLLSNAVDATAKLEEPIVQVITRYSFGASFAAQGSDEPVRLPVEIIVRDNGPGVPDDMEQDIFSPFVSTKAEGQGLGLALVRKLMSDMNGRIRYERPEGSGVTQFVLFLPIATRD